MTPHHSPPAYSRFFHAATLLWLSMIAGILLFAAIVSGFLWFLGDRLQAGPNVALLGEVGALAGAVSARWFPKSALLRRRFDFQREDQRLDAFRLGSIVGLALAEAGALVLLVAMLISQTLLPALFFLALPLWSMLALRPSMHAFEAFCQLHRP